MVNIINNINNINKINKGIILLGIGIILIIVLLNNQHENFVETTAETKKVNKKEFDENEEKKEEEKEEEQAFELINNRPDIKGMNTSITGMCIGLCRLKKFRNNFFGDSNNKTTAEEPSKDTTIPAVCTAKYRKENKITDYIGGENGGVIADCAEFDNLK